jgi:hypothetical protein
MILLVSRKPSGPFSETLKYISHLKEGSTAASEGLELELE